jgi:quercetin dioxygenase-like cupin family protein
MNNKKIDGVVKTGWGYELIWATNNKYCGKIMVFERAGNKCSMHFHREKDKTWFVNSGKFKLRWIDTNTGTLYELELSEGDTWHNPPLQPHQLEALTDNASVSEVSTADNFEDIYQIIPGDVTI